jgi:adenine-specific DNA methylase
MRRLEAKGRRIDPFDLFLRRVLRELTGMRELWEECPHDATVRTLRGDATALKRTLNSHKFDVAITSPPYNNAVDYYRRHNLEMYWLGCVSTHEDRLALAPSYLGRSSVRKNHPRLSTKFESKYVSNLVAHARQISPSRERSIIHYCASMARSFEGIAAVLKPRGKAIFVVGNSKWNGRRVRATRLLIELAKDNFKLIECFSYASKNRYMSYDRHNGADINREYVVVLERRD